MKRLLSLLAAGVLALASGLAGAATPRAAEDPSGEVTVSDAPPPRLPAAKPALGGKTAAANAAKSAGKSAGKAGKTAAKVGKGSQAKAGPTRKAKKKR